MYFLLLIIIVSLVLSVLNYNIFYQKCKYLLQRNDEFTMFYTNFFVELYDIFSREKGSYRNDNYLILLDFIQLILFLSQCPQSSVTHLQLQSECNQDIIIKDQIYIIILFFCMNMLLSCYKCIAFSHFHQKFLQITDYTCL